MRARLLKFLQDLSDAFWVLPAVLVAAGFALGAGLVEVERAGLVPQWLINGWLYSGGETGARTLLGAVAGSSIGVAGTIFSITIAALTLASQQMGPRLLRNFTRDRGNQWTLGVLLGSFAYALMVLRTVRGGEDGFVPHLSITVGIGMALWCIGMLVYFVHHMATRINVDTVIELVHRDLVRSAQDLTLDAPQAEPAVIDWTGASPLSTKRSGYLQQLDAEGLADWACDHDCVIRLLIRPGDHVFPGAAIALVQPDREGAAAAVDAATALGADRASPADLTYAARQLVEVAVRALSPGINDPMTAISVLDRLADLLCRIVPRDLPTGCIMRKERAAVVCEPLSYAELVGAMFDLIRQSAVNSPAVLSHMLKVLAVVASQETRPERLDALRSQAASVAQAGRLVLTDRRDRGAFDAAHRAVLRAAFAPTPATR